MNTTRKTQRTTSEYRAFVKADMAATAKMVQASKRLSLPAMPKERSVKGFTLAQVLQALKDVQANIENFKAVGDVESLAEERIVEKTLKGIYNKLVNG